MHATYLRTPAMYKILLHVFVYINDDDDDDDVAREIGVLQGLRVLQAHLAPAVGRKKKYNVVPKVIRVNQE